MAKSLCDRFGGKTMMGLAWFAPPVIASVVGWHHGGALGAFFSGVITTFAGVVGYEKGKDAHNDIARRVFAGEVPPKDLSKKIQSAQLKAYAIPVGLAMLFTTVALPAIQDNYQDFVDATKQRQRVEKRIWRQKAYSKSHSFFEKVID